MSRPTQNVMLLLLGLAAGVIVVKGTYLYYVKPALQPWLVFSAAALVVLAVVAIIRDLRRAPAPSDGCDVAEHRHRAGSAWLLLVPIALIAFVAPPPLGANGAGLRSVSPPRKQHFAPLPAGRAPTLSVPELVMRAAAGRTVDDRLVTVTGFTLKYEDNTDLGRVVIVCCAADAQLARLHLAGPGLAAAAGYPEDTWLRVEGRILPGSSQASTNFVPTFVASAVTRIEKPTNTYAY
jgi:putative membrane protein